MVNNITKILPNINEGTIKSKVADNWVIVKTSLTESTECQLSYAVNTINSLKDQLSEMATVLENLKAYIGELESERTTYPR